MNTQAGDRIRAVRNLMALTQDEMAEVLHIQVVRYKNVEKKNVRMAEQEFAAFCSKFPEFSHYITHQGKINLEELKSSKENLVRFAAASIDTGRVPEGFYIQESLS